jgi:hypothetical protein
MKPVEIVFGVIGVVVILGAAYMLTRPEDPVFLARYKCETALERFAGDIDASQAKQADVKGDVFNGRVEMPFTQREIRNIGLCVFRNGEMVTLDLNGKLLAGTRQ